MCGIFGIANHSDAATQTYQTALLQGYGDLDKNTGPIWISSLDPVANMWVDHVLFQTEKIVRFDPIGDRPGAEHGKSVTQPIRHLLASVPFHCAPQSFLKIYFGFVAEAGFGFRDIRQRVFDVAAAVGAVLRLSLIAGEAL